MSLFSSLLFQGCNNTVSLSLYLPIYLYLSFYVSIHLSFSLWSCFHPSPSLCSTQDGRVLASHETHSSIHAAASALSHPVTISYSQSGLPLMRGLEIIGARQSHEPPTYFCLSRFWWCCSVDVLLGLEVVHFLSLCFVGFEGSALVCDAYVWDCETRDEYVGCFHTFWWQGKHYDNLPHPIYVPIMRYWLFVTQGNRGTYTWSWPLWIWVEPYYTCFVSCSFPVVVD